MLLLQLSTLVGIMTSPMTLETLSEVVRTFSKFQFPAGCKNDTVVIIFSVIIIFPRFSIIRTIKNGPGMSNIVGILSSIVDRAISRCWHQSVCLSACSSVRGHLMHPGHNVWTVCDRFMNLHKCVIVSQEWQFLFYPSGDIDGTGPIIFGLLVCGSFLDRNYLVLLLPYFLGPRQTV